MILSNTLSLWFLLLLLPMIWVWRRSLVDHSRGLKLASFLLRLLAFGALVVALCRPYWPQANDRQHVIYLVDGSQSISPDSLLQAPAWIQNAGSGSWASSSRPITAAANVTFSRNQ